jgi:uncharacterized protein (DUF1330 family)
MTVYIINNMTIHDREAYKTYLRAFSPVFERHGGSVLAVQDSPRPMEGAWPYDRTVLLSFPSRQAAEDWIGSPEYVEIARYRKAGTVSNVVMLDAFIRPAG